MKKIKMARSVTLTFEEGCNKYLENCRQRNLREGTINHYEYTITEYDLNELKKRKYKVVLEEENCLNNWDLDLLSKFGVEEVGGHFEIKDGVLLQYVGEERDIIIPDGVIEIGIDAFKGCESFNSIKIPKTVEKISCVGGVGCRTKHLEVDKDNPKYYIQNGCLKWICKDILKIYCFVNYKMI